MTRIKSGPTPVSGGAETEQLHVTEKLSADAGMMPCWHKQMPWTDMPQHSCAPPLALQLCPISGSVKVHL